MARTTSIDVVFDGEGITYYAHDAVTGKKLNSLDNLEVGSKIYVCFYQGTKPNKCVTTVTYSYPGSYNYEKFNLKGSVGQYVAITGNFQVRAVNPPLTENTRLTVYVRDFLTVRVKYDSGFSGLQSAYRYIEGDNLSITGTVNSGYEINKIIAKDSNGVMIGFWAKNSASLDASRLQVSVSGATVTVNNASTIGGKKIDSIEFSSYSTKEITVALEKTAGDLQSLEIKYQKLRESGWTEIPLALYSTSVQIPPLSEIAITCRAKSGKSINSISAVDSNNAVIRSSSASNFLKFSATSDCTVVINTGSNNSATSNSITLSIPKQPSNVQAFTARVNNTTINLGGMKSVSLSRVNIPYTIRLTALSGYEVTSLSVSGKSGGVSEVSHSTKDNWWEWVGFINEDCSVSASTGKYTGQKESEQSSSGGSSGSGGGSVTPVPTPSQPTSGIPPFSQYNYGSYYVYYVNTLHDTTPQPLLVTVGNQYGKNLLTWAPAPTGQTFKGWFTNNGRWISNSTTVQYDDGNYLYPAYEAATEDFFSKYEWERGWAKGNKRDHMGDITIRNNTGKNIIVNKLCVPFWHAFVAPGEALMSAQGWMYYNDNQLNNVDVDYEFWVNGTKIKTVASKTRNGRIPGSSRGYTRIPPTWAGDPARQGEWYVCEFYPWASDLRDISQLPTMQQVITDSLEVKRYNNQPIPSGCMENISQSDTRLGFKLNNGQVLVVKVYKKIAENQVNGILVGPFFMRPFTGSLAGEDPNMSHAFRCDKWIDWEYEDIAPTIAAEPEGGVTLEDTIKLKVTDDHGFNRTSFQYRNSQGWRSSGGTEIDFTFTNNIYFVEDGESTVTFYCCGSGYKKEGQLVVKTNVQPRFDTKKDTEICVLAEPDWDEDTGEKVFKVSLKGTASTKASFANGYCNQVRAIATIGDKTFESEWTDCPLYDEEYWTSHSALDIDLTDSFPDNINDFYDKEWTVRVEFRHISHSLEGVRAKELISVGNNAFTASGYTPIDPSAGELRSLLKDNLVYYIPNLDISKPRVLWSFFKNVTSEMKFLCVNVAQNNDAVTDISSEQEGKFEYYWVNNNQMEQIIPDEGETITEKLNEDQFSGQQIFIAYKILDGAKKDAITNLSNKINTYDIETVQTLEDLIGQYLPSYIERSTFTSVDKYLQCTDQIYSMIRDFDNDQREKFQTIIDLISELLNTIYPNNVTLQATFLRVNPKEGEEDNKTSDCKFTNLQYKYLPYFIESDVITADSLNGISIELDYDGITVESISSTYGYFKLLTQMGLRDKIEVPYMSMVTESGVVDGTVEFENLVKLIDFYYNLQELRLPGVYDPAEQPEPKDDIKKIHIAINTDREGEVVPANALKITTTGGDIWWAWYDVEDHLVVAKTSEVDAENHEIEYPAPVVVERERLLKIKNDLANGIIFMIRNMF